MAKLHQSSVSIPLDIREKSIRILQVALASATDLQTQVKQAHWNVKGAQFYSLHLLFDTIAGDLHEMTDEIAERITALGGTALGAARHVVTGSLIPAYPDAIYGGIDHVKALAERVAALANLFRAYTDEALEWHDAATSDLFVGLVRTLDKKLWFLEAHLQHV